MTCRGIPTHQAVKNRGARSTFLADNLALLIAQTPSEREWVGILMVGAGVMVIALKQSGTTALPRVLALLTTLSEPAHMTKSRAVAPRPQ